MEMIAQARSHHGIAAKQAYPDLTEPQKRELDYRIDDYEMNPDNLLTWEEIKASIKGQR